jgi:hypothetical protein
VTPRNISARVEKSLTSGIGQCGNDECRMTDAAGVES